MSRTFLTSALTLTLTLASLAPASASQDGQYLAMGPNGSGASSKTSLRSAYQIHKRKRNIHAAHLNRLWEEERNLTNERDVRGRAGDMVSVQAIERELYNVRQEIDWRRTALTNENRIMAQIDEQLARR